MIACQKGHLSTATLLLEKGADKQLHNKVSLYIIIIYIALHKKMNFIMYFT